MQQNAAFFQLLLARRATATALRLELPLLDLVGGQHGPAILLSLLLDLAPYRSDSDGRLAITWAEVHAATRIEERTGRRYLRTLEDLGLLQSTRVRTSTGSRIRIALFQTAIVDGWMRFASGMTPPDKMSGHTTGNK